MFFSQIVLLKNHVLVLGLSINIIEKTRAILIRKLRLNWIENLIDSKVNFIEPEQRSYH